MWAGRVEQSFAHLLKANSSQTSLHSGDIKVSSDKLLMIPNLVPSDPSPFSVGVKGHSVTCIH